MMRIIRAHNISKVIFGIHLCRYLILKKSVYKSLKFGPKWQFFYFKPILSAIFVTIAMVKVNWKPGYYTSVILLINQSKEIGEKQLAIYFMFVK